MVKKRHLFSRKLSAWETKAICISTEVRLLRVSFAGLSNTSVICFTISHMSDTFWRKQRTATWFLVRMGKWVYSLKTINNDLTLLIGGRFEEKKEAAHLVIKSFCHWGAQISQIWLNVSIHNLLVVNVNLQKTELFLTLIRYKNQVMPETLFRVLNKKKPKPKHYDHRVKWFTTKNRKKRMRMFKRSSKRMKKTRQITPHAMCRHMVEATRATSKWCIVRKREVRLCGRGRRDYRSRERITQNASLHHQIDQYVWSATPFYLSDLILTKPPDQVDSRDSLWPL